MDEPTDSTPTAPPSPDTAPPALAGHDAGSASVAEGDAVLDGYERDLDDVAAALDALDADGLAAAEVLAAGLSDTPAPDEPPPVTEP